MIKKITVVLLLVAFLGCNNQLDVKKSTFSIGVTDAPVENAEAVNNPKD